MNQIKPATPLPWRIGEVKEARFPSYPIVSKIGGNIADVSITARGGSDRDAAYIVHACNAYPELVEALHVLNGLAHGLKIDSLDQTTILAKTDDLLAKLGEV